MRKTFEENEKHHKVSVKKQSLCKEIWYHEETNGKFRTEKYTNKNKALTERAKQWNGEITQPEQVRKWTDDLR